VLDRARALGLFRDGRDSSVDSTGFETRHASQHYRYRRARDRGVDVDMPDWPKMTWVVDNRDETNPVPIATFPLPPVEIFGKRGGRYGSHNLHENPPVKPAHKSEKIILATFFNGGLRAYDVSNPYQPKEVAYFVPPASPQSPTGFSSINDVLVDERQIVYTVDRERGGLFILEMEF